MPTSEYGGKWRGVFDTSQPSLDDPPTIAAGASVWVPDRCLLVLEQLR
jgi:hypothetical protein